MPKTILIADADAEFVWSVSKILTAKKFNVIPVFDGISVLKAINQQLPDLVILNSQLPNLDGVEVIAQLKLKHPHLPFILISNTPDVTTAMEAVKLGTTDLLVKPFELTKLYQTIDLAFKQTEKQFHRELILKKVNQYKHISLPFISTSLVSVSLLFIAVYLLYFTFGRPVKRVTRSYTVPASHISAITFEPAGKHDNFKGKIWFTDWYEQKLYQYIVPGFRKIQVTFLPEARPSAFTIDNNYLWLCDPWTKSIQQYTISRPPSSSEPSTPLLVATYKSPGNNPTGIGIFQEKIWTCDAETKRIYRHKIDPTLTVEMSYPTPGPYPFGLYWDGMNLWSGDLNNNRIYRHQIDEQLNIIEEIDINSLVVLGKKGLTGFTVDETGVWLCSEGMKSVFYITLPDRKKYFFRWPIKVHPKRV